MLDLADFPLMVHANDVLDNGKDAQLPWEAFTFDNTK
jgi:glycerol-3-phosphate dehydrogenase (NAD(P)+)